MAATGLSEANAAAASSRHVTSAALSALPAFKPDLQERAWQSIPHPTLPLIATAHQKSVTVFSLKTLSSHSTLTGGHNRSVRSVAWKPNAGSGQLCLVTGSFDSTAGLWRYDNEKVGGAALEQEVTASSSGRRHRGGEDSDDGGQGEEDDWEFTLVLEGHDSEVKSVSFSPAGQYLATCSRDKSVWIWEDVGQGEADDEWETVAVLNEHDGDVKAVAWCPEIKTSSTGRSGRYSSDVLASASYDDTVRIWREDNDGEWMCVAVLEGHSGTVWGLQWEPNAPEGRFPRLMTWSADCTIRLWSLKEDEEADEEGQQQPPQHAWSSGLGGIPNTMRRSVKEEWTCTSTLPAAHTREIYTVAWSADTGLVASSGSDGKVFVYAEGPHAASAVGDAGSTAATDHEAAAELDGDDDVRMGGGAGSSVPQPQSDADIASRRWRVVGVRENAHGPFEVNHVTWCKRWDEECPAAERGKEEMLVTTGDDGVVRPWALRLQWDQ
ncbi:WD40-repeat-containing domain protein [Microdochium bolleyi]|uniref:Probable cytosolic iron-sulfur protein assembly protein 1 n=1 Tax=Microdochium bolleyi TaxID=196109 RepID=A0A136IP52_9PEZI|nr:WD40-repeat-containing domain protein [Microdochium bolleyi]